MAYPLAQSFEKRLKFASNWRHLLPAILIMMSFFIPWDIWFTKADVWHFNEDYVLGPSLFSLPFEEWLFFIIVPFACVFIYEVLNYFFPTQNSQKVSRVFLASLALVLVIVGLTNLSNLYTAFCFLTTSVAILILLFVNPFWMNKFLRAYLVSLVPFLLINGFLTGNFTEEPVVIYNQNAILGIRILSIPIEDSIYNFLMFLMVISFYEKSRS
jgi:lycopene cyclase domain-containing protein